MTLEHFFQCPYCWENISMILETHISETYIEDCEVCCHPIQITKTCEDNELIAFEAKNIEE